MPVDESYVRDLEEAISKFMAPLKDIPFPVVIKSLSGYSVMPFNQNDDVDRSLLQKLSKAMAKATKKVNEDGIFSNRPNEVGNQIEPFVRQALNDLGLTATIPKTKRGVHKSAGYPDIEIKEDNGRITYLECKTYNLKSGDSSQRAFYLSPSEDTKITVDARHLLVGFEVQLSERSNKPAYVPVRWGLYTLDKLRVQVKYEFNASNKNIYLDEALLAEGGLP